MKYESICKRIIGGALAVGITLSSLTCGAMAAKVTDFTDVPTNAWYYSAVDYAAQNGLFNGTSKNTFSPNSTMTRGMFVTVLGNLHGINKGEYGYSLYSDVKSTDYFCAAASWASENGIVGGVGGGKFNPGGNVTREQIAVMLYKYFNKFGFDLVEKTSDINAFQDASEMSSYATDAMEWATAYGVIGGSGGKLLPKGSASRAQVAQMLLNFDGLERYKAEETPAPTPTPKPTPNPSPAPSDDPLANYNEWFESRVWEAEMEATGYKQWMSTFDNVWRETTRLADFESQEAYDNAYNEAYLSFRDNIVNPWIDNYNATVTYDIPTGCSEPDEQGGYYDYDLANEVMNQINIIRAENGKGPLKYNPVVAGWAETRAKECSILFDHVRPDGSGALTVGGGSLIAENIQQSPDSKRLNGTSNEEMARAIAKSWYNSTGHRANMLSARDGSVAVVSCYVLPGYEMNGIEFNMVNSAHLFSNGTPLGFDFQ